MEQQNTLYHPSFEHDNCGIGAVVHIDGSQSHGVVDDALKIVEGLEHRAGKDADGQTGDGVGILTQIPHGFFSKVAKQQGIALGEKGQYAVGMFFFSQDKAQQDQAKQQFETLAQCSCTIR